MRKATRRNLFKPLLIFLAGLCLAALTTTAQAATPVALTLFDAVPVAKVASANVIAAQPVSTAGVKRSRAARVQAATISAITTNLSAHTVLNLFDGLNVEVEWLRQEQISVGNIFWSGRLTDDPLSTVDLSVVKGIPNILVTSPKYGLFDLEPQADGSLAVRELDEDQIKGNGQCVEESTNVSAATAPVLKSAAVVSGSAGVTPMATYTPVTVDVLVVYTPAVTALLGGHSACLAKAQAGVNSENSTFGRSGIVHHIRLVNAREVNHVSSGNLATELNWVAGSAEVKAIRDEVGADVVAYMSEKDTANMFGIAQEGGPFSSMYYSTFSGVWPHEVGHNQGAGHDKANGGGVYSYSHAHYWNNGTKVVGTIMSYTGSRISYFSNPNVSYQGFPTGVTNDQDNARTINEFDPTIAGWKPSKLLIDAAVGIAVSTPIPAERSTFNILVTATNAGPEVATNITVNVPLPGTLSYVSDNGGGAYNSATGAWRVPSLAAGSNVLLIISAKPNTGTRGAAMAIAAVVASVGTNFVDYYSYNNSNSVTIVPQADLSTTYVWTNSLSGLWSAAVNWTNSAPPPAGGTNTGVLQFLGATGYTASNDFPGIFKINFLDFASSSTNQSGIAGNLVQFVAYSASAKPQCFVHASGSVVVSNQLVLSDSLNLFSPSGKPLWLAGGISGPGGILKNDGNRLLLSASNSFTGSLQVNAGSVEVSNLQALSQCYYVNVASGARLALQGGGSYPPTALEITGDGGGGGSLAFNYASNGFSIWPGNITLLDNATIGSSGAWVTNTFSGAITGNGDLTLLAQGSSSNHLGVFVLSNSSNSWSGDTYVSAGASASCQLKLAASNALPVAARVVLDSAGDAFHFGQFDLNGFSQTLAGLESDSTTNSIFNSSVTAAALTVNQSQDDNWAFAMSGPLTVTRTGGGTVTWSGVASHTGGTALRGGFTIVNGRVVPGLVSVGPGWIGGGGFVQNLVVTNKGVLSPGLSGAAATLAVSNLTCTSGARLVFSITNRLTVGGGTNDFITVSNVAITGATTVSLNLLATPTAGRYVFLRAAGAISGTNNLALAPEILNTRFQAALDLSVSNEIAVVIGVAVAPQNLVWRGDGLTNQWDIGATTNWLVGATPQVFYNADAVMFDDSGSNAPSIALVGTLAPGSISVNSSNAFTLTGSGSLIGPADITKQGSADFTLSTANNFSSGTVFLEAGQLWLANINALSGMSAVTVADGAELTMNKTGTYANVPVTITGNGDTTGHGALYFRSAGTVTWPGEIDLNGASQISIYSGGLTVNLNGPITDAAEATSDLTLMASGASSTQDQYYVLKTPCTYGGNTTFDTYFASCHVKVGVNNALPIGTVLTLAGGITKSVPEIAELQLNGFSQQLAGLTTAAGTSGSGGVNQIINTTTNAGELTINNFDDFIFNGSLGEVGTNNNFSLTKLGPGTFILAGTNSFTGPLSVGGGTLVVSNLSAIPAGCVLTLNNVPDAVFKLENTVQLGALNGGGTLGGNVNLGTNSLIVGDAQDATFAGTIYGTGGVTKIGTNTTWTLTGANTFTGPLVVNAGTLIINGTLATNVVTVNATGVLAGSGSLAGSATIAAGGTLALAVSNNLSISNNLTFQAGCTAVIQINALAGTSGQVAGLNLAAYGGSLVVTNLGGTLAAGNVFKLFTATRYTNSFASLTLPALADGLSWANRLNVDGTLVVSTNLPALPLITLLANDAAGTTSITGSTNWSNGAVPSGTNDYSTASHAIRALATATFAGNSLTVQDGGGEIIGKFGTTGTLTVTNLILTNGIILEANNTTDSGIMTLAGGLTVLGTTSSLGAQGKPTAPETIDITSVISGAGALTVPMPANTAALGPIKLSAANPYSGTITVSNYATIGSTVNRMLQLNNPNALSNATLNLTATLANPVSFASAANTWAFNVGAFTGSSAQALTDTAGAAVTLSVGSGSFTGSLTGSGAVTKVGNGTLTLSGANTYSGNTTISNGVVFNNGVVSVSPVTVMANGTLRGVGIFSSAVTNNGTLAPGTLASLGTLTISNTLTLGATSTNNFRLDAGAVTNDNIAGLTTVNYGGTFIVTNVNGALVLGYVYQLFKAGVYNGSFSNLTLPALAGGLAWTNRLSVNGTLAIYSTTPPLLSLQITNGNSLRFFWPDGYTGYRLQIQTNSLSTGLSGNWVDWPNSTQTNSVVVPVILGNPSVFLRLVYP